MGTTKQTQQPKPEPEDAPAGAGDDQAGKKKQRAPRVPKAEGGIRRKRGPPRPHRKLTQEVLESRISKLNKRIEKAKEDWREKRFAMVAGDPEFIPLPDR